MKRIAGFINVDKPAGITSRAAVDRAVAAAGTRKVGHAGTLDPAATGVLVLAVGRATRLIEYVQRMRKTYEAEFTLGAVSDTDDSEGTVRVLPDAPAPDRAEVQSALKGFIGTIEQVPPQYSAVKISGRRAYDLARQGRPVTLKRRRVNVFAIELIRYVFPTLELRIECGGGTYIRSIARDLGAALGTGGMMSRLCRTAVGSFDLSKALPLDRLTKACWADHLQPCASAVSGLPKLELNTADASKFRLGQRVSVSSSAVAEVAVFDADQRFLGVGAVDPQSGRLRPTKGGFAEIGGRA